jgi:flagellin-like protein
MRRIRADGVSPVIAIILLVAITVVLTAVLYIVVTDIARQAQEVTPTIYIGEMPGGSSPPDRNLEVLGATPARPFVEFRLKLFIDGTEDLASTRTTLAAGTVGNVTFIDRDGAGTVTQGDQFLVTGEVGHQYELALFWKGRLADGVVWET